MIWCAGTDDLVRILILLNSHENKQYANNGNGEPKQWRVNIRDVLL